MFTGLVAELGTVERLVEGSTSCQLTVRARKILPGVKVGDSIAVNGVCLTVVHLQGDRFTADVMPETVRRTSLAELKKGSPVNLERALTLASRLGGHIVSGHIDGTGEIVKFADEGNAILMTVSADSSLLRYIVEKGSVALDGISLTVAQVTDSDFTVSLIPHTREVTNLGSKKVGSPINIETDVLGKYVEKLLRGREASEKTGGLTREFLLQNGF